MKYQPKKKAYAKRISRMIARIHLAMVVAGDPDITGA